jgi:hypothetical protein
MSGRGLFSLLLLLVFAGMSHQAVAAPNDKVRITGLSDFQLGTLGIGGDVVVAQSVCAFSGARTSGYLVSGSGIGTGGGTILQSPAGELPIELQWAGQSGQTTGTIVPVGALGGPFYSNATHQFCNNGPSSSASLIVRVREADIGAAPAGLYSGNITIILAPL